MEPRSKVLITGVDGFTGFHISKYLQNKGLEIIGTSFNSSKYHIRLDITSEVEVESVLDSIKPDYIIHLAAISFVDHPYPIDFYKVNTLGTENLLKSLIKIGLTPRKILIPSSATIYGNQGVSLLHEEMNPSPRNHYGCSKLAMEYMAKNFFEKLPIIVSRPFNYTGPLQSDAFVIPKIVNHFKRREKTIELGNVDVFREFNDVRLIAEIYYQLLVSAHKSIVVNTCSSKTYSLRNVLDSLERITKHKLEVLTNPKFVRPNEIRELRGSNSLLNSIISVSENYSLSDTLKMMVDS